MSQNPTAILAVQEILIKKGVQAGVECRVIEVLRGDKVEETSQCRHCESQISHIKTVGEEVHKDFWTAKTVDSFWILQLLQQLFSLRCAHRCSNLSSVPVHRCRGRHLADMEGRESASERWRAELSAYKHCNPLLRAEYGRACFTRSG